MTKFRTLELAHQFYNDCQSLKLRHPMKDQFDRALLSIPLNLSEGRAKESRKERRKFYRISLGSFREVECILRLSNQDELLQKANMLGAHLYRLCQRT